MPQVGEYYIESKGSIWKLMVGYPNDRHARGHLLPCRLVFDQILGLSYRRTLYLVL